MLNPPTIGARRSRRQPIGARRWKFSSFARSTARSKAVQILRVVEQMTMIETGLKPGNLRLGHRHELLAVLKVEPINIMILLVLIWRFTNSIIIS